MSSDSVLDNLKINRIVVTEELTNKMEFVHTWFLMSSPVIPITILAAYLVFVLSIGPSYMKHRQPYKMTKLILFYNVVQVIVSVFLIYSCGRMLAVNGLVPKTCGLGTEFDRQGVAAGMYYYLLAKFSELADTIFFVLRKKQRQISFLHVYHHTLVVVVTWTALKYEPTIHLLFIGVANGFVHVIMYAYYGLSTFPRMAKYLWWKKYLTGLQLVQFVAITTLFIISTVLSECTPSYILLTSLITNMLLFLYLFGNFYVSNYTKKYKNADASTVIKEKVHTFPEALTHGWDIKTNGNEIINASNGNLRKRQDNEVSNENEFANNSYTGSINSSKTIKRVINL